MNYDKKSIKIKEWVLYISFFIISILYGKLVYSNSIESLELLNKAEIGIECLFYILMIITAIYGILQLIKKNYTVESMWLFTGIFILLSFLGVYQFELLFKYYNIVLNNVLFHDIMISHPFSIIYAIFFLYYITKIKIGNKRNGLTRTNIIILFMLLILPLFRSLNLYIFKDVIDGVQSNKSSIITQIIFSDNMHYAEKANKGEIIMDQLMRVNNYIDFFYPITIYGTICCIGIALFREKITYQKYLALAGTFIWTQYNGILYFDKLLNYFNHSFYTANINLLYKIVLNYSYSLIFILFLVIYLLKKIIKLSSIKQEKNHL